MTIKKDFIHIYYCQLCGLKTYHITNSKNGLDVIMCADCQRKKMKEKQTKLNFNNFYECE